jgi:hypothetical protein
MQFDSFRPLIEDRRLLMVFDHWCAARGSKRLPAWSDIDPLAIAPALPIVWSWRLDEAGDLRGRLAGEEIITVFGTGIKGKLIGEFLPPDITELADARYRRVMAGPACWHTIGTIYRCRGRPGSGERIALPLATDGEHGDGILGATAYHARPSLAKLTLEPFDAATFVAVP